jgi:tetratricopeptide (TPR) repeat protein
MILPIKRFFPLLFISLIMLLTQGCTLYRMTHWARKQEVTVEPAILAVSGDKVTADLKATIPLKVLQKDHTYDIRAYYKYADKMDWLGTLAFVPGEFVYENGKPTIERQLSFDYTPAKEHGSLVIQGVATNPKGKTRTTPLREMAKGTLATSKLIVRNDDPAYAPDAYSPDADGPLVFTFFFDQGSAKIRPYVGTPAELLGEFIASDKLTRQVEIVASHSPEKEDAEDSRLPARRARVLQNFYKQKLRQASQVNTLESLSFKVIPHHKEWGEFLRRVQASALPQEQKDKIVSIVNGKGSYEEKEEQLRQLENFEYLELYVYPTLRYAEVRIDYDREQKRDYEIYLLSKRIVEKKIEASALTDEELQYAATLTPLLAEKRAIYEAAVAKNQSWQAYNNLGIVYLEMARKETRERVRKALLQKAIVNLTFAGHRNPTAQSFYNLAAAYHLRGDLLEALQYYDYSIKLGGPLPALQKIFLDKAALEMEVGQFDDAIASLAYAGVSYASLMNKGLSYMLKENYEGAQEFYGKALELKPADPLAHYAMAVLGARTKNEQLLGDHLKQALRADKKLVRKAIDDLEFRDYKKSTNYQEAFR